MKRFLVLPLLIITGYLVAAYANLLSNQSAYQQSLTVSNHSVLSLKNLDKSNIQIIIGDNDEILIELTGNEADLASLSLTSEDLFSEFGFSDQWKNIQGTITVPEGVLIEMNLSEEINVAVNDINGKNTFTEKKTLAIDTTGLDTISIQPSSNSNSKPTVQVKDWGEATILDTETWTILDPENSDENMIESPEIEEPLESQKDDSPESLPTNQETSNLAPTTRPSAKEINSESFESTPEAENDPFESTFLEGSQCRIGSTPLRNYCCQLKNRWQEVECNGIAYWTFNPLENQCAPQCDPSLTPNTISNQQDSEDPENTTPTSQSNEGNQENITSNNNQNQDNDDAIDDEEIIIYDDPTSQFCADNNQAIEERDFCCNETLKNNLSTGPRPGFPDCIGRWYFNRKDGCSFRCAEHTEMLEILNELKQNAASNN